MAGVSSFVYPDCRKRIQARLRTLGAKDHDIIATAKKCENGLLERGLRQRFAHDELRKLKVPALNISFLLIRRQNALAGRAQEKCGLSPIVYRGFVAAFSRVQYSTKFKSLIIYQTL